MTEQRGVCPTCGNDRLRVLGPLPDSAYFAGTRLQSPIHGGRLLHCTYCRLKFRHPREPASQYDSLYDNAVHTNWDSRQARNDHDLVLACIRHLKPTGGRVLDIGCYSGGLLARLDSRFGRFGVEINRAAAEEARRSAGATVWSGLEEVPPDWRFDVIVLVDVIEHFADPRQVLRMLGVHLATDGVVMITTGDADTPMWKLMRANWWYCFYPEHIAFISEAWIRRCLLTDGWTLRRICRFRYLRLPPLRRLAELLGVIAYGLSPKRYLRAVEAWCRLRGSSRVARAPGCGALADHILVVLGRTPPA